MKRRDVKEKRRATEVPLFYGSRFAGPLKSARQGSETGGIDHGLRRGLLKKEKHHG